MMGTLLDYWHYTGDDQYNGLIRDALIHQFGEHLDLVRRRTTQWPPSLAGLVGPILGTHKLTSPDARQPIQERRQR